MNDEREDRVEDGSRQLEARAKRVFDESVESLDARIRSQLHRRRQRALDASHRRGVPRRLRWVPAAGAAAVAAIGVLLWDGDRTSDHRIRASNATDLELLMDEESFEMLEELEFYSWIELESNDEGLSGENVG